ncbi:MAG: hypothetical protein HC902_04425 [Calothrix sp. SM1_5_4]|nr:hypothetical protein [Calothrix sp. SM1_5_4]
MVFTGPSDESFSWSAFDPARTRFQNKLINFSRKVNMVLRAGCIDFPELGLSHDSPLCLQNRNGKGRGGAAERRVFDG